MTDQDLRLADWLASLNLSKATRQAVDDSFARIVKYDTNQPQAPTNANANRINRPA